MAFNRPPETHLPDSFRSSEDYANNFGLKGHHPKFLPCSWNQLSFQSYSLEKIIYMYNPSLPLTAPILLSTLKKYQEIQVLYGVPYALKLLLAEIDEAYKQMVALSL